jgi:geranyl-CoA carboxylase alpha subunit
MPFRNVLVANRGEIALRIMRTARALGYRTTAIYSAADADALHVAFADAAVPVGPAQVSASYLNIAAVVQAAREAGADAVHPGYGLLSENAAFARACAQAGLVFIGPSPETIELMGDKRRARIAMRAAGVPCVPGYDGDDQSDAALTRAAAAVGFPLMVKAAAGGGGRGLRRVRDAAQLGEAIARARSEALKAFGDDRLMLERAIEGARHIEVQIFADRHGHAIHLGERDCSVQRRFQKVIEEAPAPGIDAELRTRMGEVAVLAAKSSGYVGAGTIEMLLDARGDFYFLEMNTRLQVEHAVTEMLTGVDLVAWQLKVAQGEALPLTQDGVRLHGHAIEARLYAEDPEHGFVPSTGRVLALRLPDDLVRVDHGLAEGLTVSSHYDPMIAKLVAHGPDREQARERLCAALDGLRVLGLRTNQAFLRAVLEHERFVAGTVTTDWLDGYAVPTRGAADAAAWAAAALAFVARAHAEGAERYPAELAGFSNSAGLRWPLALECDGELRELAIEPVPRSPAVLVHAGELRVSAALVEHGPRAIAAVIDGVRRRFDCAWDGDRLWLHLPDGARAFTSVTHARRGAQARGDGRATAPMDGVVVDVRVRTGETVHAGATLAVIEAMKLELQVTADIDGVVAAVHVQRGQQVKTRQLLVEVSREAGPTAAAATAPGTQPS